MELLYVLYSIAMMLVGLVAPTRSATCPIGWAHVGAPMSGRVTCLPALIGNENNAPRPPGTIWYQVHCAEGTRPVVVNERLVACRRALLLEVYD